MKKWFRKRRKVKIAMAILLLLFIIACVIANYYVKRYGYRNLWDFVTKYSHNASMGRDAKFETLEIEINETGFNKLKDIREKALERGILIDEEGSFVDATLHHNGKKIKAKVRLKGHMTDHLQEEKWSFRVVTKKNDAFMGMKRFSLQHPGTRNYIYEWIYHQMMKQEGIIALRYHFIKLKVNKKSWGIYAVEEHFAQQLVENNERLKGPIIRFSPELYWTARINELKKVRIIQDYSKFQSAYVEPYDDNNTYKDSALLDRYAKAVQLIEGFRRGELKTSQVFDLDKLAKFHAIIDLVGGHHSLDWSDVKYYYNNVTNKLEPVAYESFSIRNTASLAGSNRFALQKPEYITDLHNALFSDPDFFEKYINELQRIASKKWLDAFLRSIDKDLQANLGVLYKDYPYKNYSPDDYYRNIKNISHILNDARGVQANINRISPDSIYVDIGGIDALPYEVLSIQFNDKLFAPAQRIIVPPKSTSGYVQFNTRAFAGRLTDSISARSDIRINYRILGRKNETKQSLIVPVPAYNKDFADRLAANAEPNTGKFPFVSINEAVREIRILPGRHILKESLVFPSGYQVHISAGTGFDLQNASGIVSYSPVLVLGTEEEPVIVQSSDSTGSGITVIHPGQKSLFNHLCLVQQRKVKSGTGHGGLTLYEADADVQYCAFIQCVHGIHAIRSHCAVRQSVFTGLENTALEIDYALVNIKDCSFSKIKGNAVSAKGANLSMVNTKFDHIKSKALYAEMNTVVKGNSIAISHAKLGVESKDASKVDVAKLVLEDCDLGLKASKKGDIYGPASILVTGLTESNNARLKEIEPKSTITIKK